MIKYVIFIFLILICTALVAKASVAADTSDANSVAAASSVIEENVKKNQPGSNLRPNKTTNIVKPHPSKQELITPSKNVSGSLVQVTLGLFIVLMVIAGAAWLTRRFGKFNITAKGNLKILAGLNMGSRERIVLMQVGEEQLLIGVTPGRIQTLHVLEKPIAVETINVPDPSNPLAKFGDVLKRVQGK